MVNKVLDMLDGRKTIIIAACVLIIGLVQQDMELISLGLLAITGRHAISKVTAK